MKMIAMLAVMFVLAGCTSVVQPKNEPVNVQTNKTIDISMVLDKSYTKLNPMNTNEISIVIPSDNKILVLETSDKTKLGLVYLSIILLLCITFAGIIVWKKRHY